MLDQFLQFFVGLSPPTLYATVFLILIGCGFGLPIPEDITLIAAGYVSYKGMTDPFAMFVISMIGVMAGDSTIFLLGSKYGRKIARKKPFSKLLTPARLDRVEKMLLKNGSKVIFAARFMPGMRAALFFSAGTLKVPFRVFFLMDGIAALLSVPAIIYTVFFFGEKIDDVVEIIKSVEYGIVAVILTGVLYLVVKKWLQKRKKRRAKSSV